MRVLVTGASGHVGGAIAEHLASEGNHVVGLSRRRATIAGVEEWIELDIGRPGASQATRVATGRCSAIVHAAAALHKNPQAVSLSLTNCLGTQEMTRLAELWQVDRLIYISGVPVVGTPRILPITESHPVAPSSPYLASKLFGEHVVHLAGSRGLSTLALRLTSPVGPGMPDGRILSVFVRRALAGEPLRFAGRGSRRQDYVDVRDVSRAVTLGLGGEAKGILNIAAGRSISNLELAERCVEATSSGSEITPTGQDDPEDGVRWEVSIDSAAEKLGYAPACTLSSSVAAVVADLGAGNRVTRSP